MTKNNLFVVPSIVAGSNSGSSIGGWQSVTTIAERDAIPNDQLKEGMAVYVTDEEKLYILSELDLTTDPVTKVWEEFESGSTDGIRKTTSFVDYEPLVNGEIVQYVGATTQNYVNGYFYKGTLTVTNTDNSEVVQDTSYTWSQVNVQPEPSEISYDNLTDKPGINGHTLSANTLASDLEISYNDLTDKPSALNPATADTLGVIKVGSGLSITEEGTLSAQSSGADITYDIEEEQLIIETGNIPSFVDLENLTLGDRLNNVASFVTYFTDTNNDRYAVFVLDAIYRTLNGTNYDNNTSVIPGYGSAEEALAVKNTATYTTDVVFSKTTPSTSNYSSFYYARNPGGTAFTTVVNGETYQSQLPNLFELNEIFTNKTALNAVDPTNTESTNLADWNFYYAAISNAIGWGGGIWCIEKNEGIKNGGWDQKGVIPVLEIPVTSPNVTTIKLDDNVIKIKDNAYTTTNLLTGDNVSIQQYLPPYLIDAHTICLFHYNDSYADAISGNEPGGYYDGWYSYVDGKFGKAISVTNTSDSYGHGLFGITSSQDFTFDYWYKFTFDTSYVLIGPVKFVRNSEYELQVYHNSDSLGTFTMTNSLNTFNHCVAQRRNQYLEVFFNGKKLSIPSTSDNWEKGTPYGFSGNKGDPIDELRVSDIARYDGDFTPLTVPYSEPDPNAEKQYEINVIDTTYSPFTGATSSVAGSSGLVPAPTSADYDKFLKGDGTWSEASSGGSVPTLTWFTSKTGNSFDTDIAGLSTKPLVKVYKNGGLLQQGESSSTDIWYVGGSGKNISLNDTAPISTANTWKVQTTVKWQESGGGSYPSIMGYTGQSDNKAPTLAYEYSHLGMFISSTGYGWDITTPESSTFNPSEGTVYEIEMGYDGTVYYLDAKAEGASSFTRYQSVTSSAKAYCSVPWMFLNNGYNLSRYYSISPLNIDKTKIIIDNEVWFDGSQQTVQRYTNPLLNENGTMGGLNYACSATVEASGCPAWKAFDGDSTTPDNCWWSGYSPTYPVDITYYYPTAINPDSLSITNENQTASNIQTAIIQGSNNGTTFDDLASITNVNVDGATTVFPISTANTYKYIRLHILSGYGAQSDSVSVQEITIHSTDGVEEQTYTNNDCTTTIFVDNDYAISGENLLFSTALVSTDKICVETY